MILFNTQNLSEIKTLLKEFNTTGKITKEIPDEIKKKKEEDNIKKALGILKMTITT